MDFLSPIYVDGDVSLTNLNLAAGTATTAPIKLTSGTNLTTPTSGAVEYDGTNLYFTPNGTRRTVAYADSVISTPVRQTVISGGVDSATGAANFLSAGTGLAVDLAATTTNVRMSFAAGYNDLGGLNYVSTINADVTGAWSSLPASNTTFLYADRNTSTGAITYGFAYAQPIYGQLIQGYQSAVPYATGYTVLDPGTGTTITISASTDRVANQAWRAFDSADSSGNYSEWDSAAGTFSGWLKTDFGASNSKVITSYAITSGSGSANNDPYTWTFEGSNDNFTTTAVLDTRTAYSFAARTTSYTFTFSNSTAYRYYRLNVSRTLGNTASWAVAICHFKLFEPNAYYANQHWFDTANMVMKVWNGTSFDIKQRVFLGEVITGASTVTTATTYALNGQYDSGAFAVTASTEYTKSHNLGVIPLIFKSYLRQNSAYQWQDNSILFNTVYYGGHTSANALTASIGFNNWVSNGAATGASVWNANKAFATGNQISGEARIVICRGW